MAAEVDCARREAERGGDVGHDGGRRGGGQREDGDVWEGGAQRGEGEVVGSEVVPLRRAAVRLVDDDALQPARAVARLQLGEQQQSAAWPLHHILEYL